MLVVDGNNLASRAFHGFGKGDEPHPTGTGFLMMLASVVDQFFERPSSVTVCFDGEGPLDRLKIFEGYKVRDPEPPEKAASRALYQRQLKELIKLLKMGGVTVLQLQHREADDIVAALAERSGNARCTVHMLSNDRDLCQVVSNHVRLLRMGQGSRDLRSMGPAEVFEDFGVWPDEYVRFAAMRGDASDGLPGVSGVGPKKAAAVIAAGLDPASASASELMKVDGVGARLAEQMTSEQELFVRNVALMSLGDRGDSLLSEAVEVDREAVAGFADEIGVSRSAVAAIGQILNGTAWRMSA